MPRRTARSLSAPNAFCNRPGDEMKAGTSSTRNEIEVAPFQKSPKPSFGAARITAVRPPACESAAGSTMTNPHRRTTS